MRTVSHVSEKIDCRLSAVSRGWPENGLKGREEDILQQTYQHDDHHWTMGTEREEWRRDCAS